MKGDLIYNGVFLTPAKLGETLAYVGQDLELCPKMSTRQTILFATLLRSPARKRTFDTKKRIDAGKAHIPSLLTRLFNQS